MPQLRISDYFQSVTTRITYMLPTREVIRDEYILHGVGLVSSGAYEEKALSDNAELIAELERISCAIKDAVRSTNTWTGIEGIEAEDLELYSAFLSFCHLIWDEDVSQTEPLVYEYMRRAVIIDNDTVHKVCWYFVDSLIHNDEAGAFRLARSSPDSEQLIMTIYADDYYKALKMQLLLHIYKGKAGRDGVDIAACRSCGKLYARSRKNSRLCSLCGSSAERSRSCRQRKRKEMIRDAAQKIDP